MLTFVIFKKKNCEDKYLFKFNNKDISAMPMDGLLTQQTNTCLKLTTEALEKGVKCSKLTIKAPERRH